MKLIAKRSFKNPGRKIQLDKPLHPDHVHKGACFEIGGAVAFDALPDADRKMIALSNQADCLAEPTAANIARIEAELVEERGREAKWPAATARFK